MLDRSTKIRELLCPKQQWVNDKDVPKCQGCQKSFVPLLVWRHHCRFCGRVFCDACAANVMTGLSIGYEGQKKLRHCNPCKYRIDMVMNQQPMHARVSQLHYRMSGRNIKIEIQDPDGPRNTEVDQKLMRRVDEEKIALEQLAILYLRNLAKELCKHYQLEGEIWQVRLAELVWKAVVQTKPEIFIRKEAFDITDEIRVVMILAPPQSVTAVCVKGLVLQRNIPSKHLQAHTKYPRIVTIKPAIEAGSLAQTKNMKFGDLVTNVGSILRASLQQVFRLNPNIMFVQQEVNQMAIQLALERRIMVISKVKPHDLQKIERLAWIRKRVDNLFYIDRTQIAQIIGCCERVYFKTVRQGQMLMFIEHEAGIRSVVLGDVTDSANTKLKKVFDTLLRAAWNLKNQREMIIRDTNIGCDSNCDAFSCTVKKLNPEKYQSRISFILSQQVLISRRRYCYKGVDNLPKTFQEYCRLMGRRGMYDPCGNASWREVQLYSGQEYSLGTFLLKFILQNMMECNQCQGQHVYRYFIDDCSINISGEFVISNKVSKFIDVVEEDNEVRKLLHSQNQKQNHRLYHAINKFLKILELGDICDESKIQFYMYFRCQECGKVMGGQRSKVGNQFLMMSISHFFNALIMSDPRGTDKSEHSLKTQEETVCQHSAVVRAFQFAKTVIKIAVTRIQKYQILPIFLNEAIGKKLRQKDEAMVTELFMNLLNDKLALIDALEMDMAKLPFSGGMNGVALSLSIAGTSALQHIFFEPFMKIEAEIGSIRSTLNEMEDNTCKYIQEAVVDWTVMLRKFAKIDHAFKVGAQCIYTIANALRKQKIEQNLQGLQDINLLMGSPVFDDSTSIRKNSEQISDIGLTKSESTMKSHSMLKKSSVADFMRVRKQSVVALESQLQAFLNKLKLKRYLKYQGAVLYYPIGRIDDAVSLLSCCLNSDQFRQILKQSTYKDEIVMKMSFLRQMRNDWQPVLQLKKVYKALSNNDYLGGEMQEVQFSIYYHKQFEELRVSEDIGFKMYLRSLYGCQSWDSSGGKSNSTFYKAHNQTLVVKIINDKEFVQFQKFAKAYLQYMRHKRQTGEDSYLAKIYGIYEVSVRSKVYKCVVMQNLFFGLDSIQRVYDLKGSEVNRLAPLKGTGLDTNFVIDRDGAPYLLDPQKYDKIMNSLVQDAIFLREQGVIDYSLLVIESGLGLRMAIIDFMRPYHLVEKIENLYKQIKNNGKDPTVIPPQHYSERFIRAMKRYFAKSAKY